MVQKHDPFGEPGCHDCPAGGAEDDHIVGMGPTDESGEAIHPKHVLTECHVGPKFPLITGRKDGHPIIDRFWPQMKGDEICYRHPGYVEKMDPEAYGELVADDEDDDEDDDE